MITNFFQVNHSGEVLANHKSAEKRVRSNRKRTLVNKRLKTSVKTHEKKLRAFIVEKNKDAAQKMLKIVFSFLDRSAKTGTFHKNKSDRKKSRLSSHVQKLS